MLPSRRKTFQVAGLTMLWLAMASICAAQCNFPARAAGRELTYTFDSTVTTESTVMHVTLKFQGNAEGTEEITLPTQWAGEKLHGITNLRALSGETLLGDTPEAGNKTLHYPANQQVVLAYDIIKDWTGQFKHPLQFHAVIMPEYIEINGENAFVYPKMDRQAPVTANFDWQKLPAPWALATSFGTTATTGDRCQSFSGPLNTVQQALFSAGDFRIHHFLIGTRPVILAIRGAWIFTDDEAVASVQKAVGMARDFWHDDNFPYFLVTMKAYDQDHGSGDGSGFTNAIWMYMSRLDPLSEYFPTLVHEAFHAWNPRRMGFIPDGGERSITWFHEGFTRYYQFALVYRNGFMPLPEYLENLNGDLRDYSASNNPYVRGHVIAVWLDQRIRKNSAGKSSLNNLMFDMVREADKPLTLERIYQTAGRYITPADRAEWQQAVENGALPKMEGLSLGPCVHFAVEDMPTFDLGFDFAASRKAGKIVGVNPDGPAFRAGLRDGQVINGRVSIDNGHTDKPAIITIASESGPQAIQYYPRGKTVQTPQFQLDQKAYAAGESSCRIQ